MTSLRLSWTSHIIGLVAFPLVILPPIVAFTLVMLVSGVLMFCAFTEFRPTIANMPIMAARIGMIKTNCFLIASLSVLLTYKGFESDYTHLMCKISNAVDKYPVSEKIFN